jgi:hypothetical protein
MITSPQMLWILWLMFRNCDRSFQHFLLWIPSSRIEREESEFNSFSIGSAVSLPPTRNGLHKSWCRHTVLTGVAWLHGTVLQTLIQQPYINLQWMLLKCVDFPIKYFKHIRLLCKKTSISEQWVSTKRDKPRNRRNKFHQVLNFLRRTDTCCISWCFLNCLFT